MGCLFKLWPTADHEAAKWQFKKNQTVQRIFFCKKGKLTLTLKVMDKKIYITTKLIIVIMTVTCFKS